MTPSPTIFDLGKTVKSKYPGLYDDLPDDEVGRKVKAKFPGAYEDFTDPRPSAVPGMEKLGGVPPAAPKAPIPNELKPEDQQEDSFWTSPHGLIRSGARQAGRGIAAMTRPGFNEKADAAMEVAEGTGKALLPAALPFAAQGAIGAGVLPAAASLVGGAALGAGGEGAAAALGAPEWLQKATGVAGAIVGGGLGAKVPAHPLRVDPRITATKALRPTPTNPQFAENVPETMKAILQANRGESPTGFTKGKFDIIPAAQKAADVYKEALEPWFVRAEGVQGSGDPIVEATAKAASRMLPSEREQAARLVQKAEQDFGGERSPREIQGILELLNKRLRSYYNGSPAAQSAALADYPEAMVVAQRDAAADTLYKLLDPEAGGANVRSIQLGRSHALDIMEDASRRNNAVLAEQPSSPMEKVLDPIKRALHLRGGPGAGISFATGNEGRTVPLLNRTFNALKGEEVNALPKPPTDFYPPTPDWQRVPESRQLGPGKAPFTQGTSVPDITGRPDLRTPYNAGLLGPGPPPVRGRAVPAEGEAAPANPFGEIRTAGAVVRPSGYTPRGLDSLTGRKGSGEFPGPDLPGIEIGDTSRVQSIRGKSALPQAEPSVIPPGETSHVINMNTQQPARSPKGATAEWWAQQPPTRPEIQARYEKLFNKSQNLSPQHPVRAPETGLPEGVARGIDKRENIARQVLGKPLSKATPTEINVIDQLISEGYGSASSAGPLNVNRPGFGVLPKYAKGGIIKSPTLLSDLKTGKPTGIMAEEGPEEIKPLKLSGESDDLSAQLDELTGRKRRAVRIPSGTFPRSIPDGMAVHVDPTSGDKIAFNPNLTSIHDVKMAVATKRLGSLLGRTHSPSAMSSTKHILKQSRIAMNRAGKIKL